MTNKFSNKLVYTNHFAKQQFIMHLLLKHHLATCVYSLRTLENIVNYGLEHKNTSRNQLAYFLFDIVPDVEFKEVAAFCEDDILTVNAQYEKDDYIENVLAYEDLTI